MSKGLSPLQKDVLAVLEEFPSYEESVGGQIGNWATPGQILKRLRREPTAANRVAMSKSLLRLYERGLVARVSSALAIVGKSFRYARITNPANAHVGNAGPSMILSRGASPMRTVSNEAQ